MLDLLTKRRSEPRLVQVQTEAIVCYHCGRMSSVSTKAMSTACEHCRKPLDLHDIVMKGPHWGGVLCTCGRITITRKARVQAKMAVASLSVDILGQFRGLVICGGPVTIGPRADFSGAVWAPTLHVEPGAEIAGGPFIVGVEPLGHVEITAGGPRPEPPADWLSTPAGAHPSMQPG